MTPEYKIYHLHKKFYEMPECNIYLVWAWCMTSTALGIEHSTIKKT